MQLDLRYVTRFLYRTPVWESHNVLRACPSEDNGQRLHSYRLEISPESPVFTYVDSWGTRVDTFEVLEPHTELVVTARARVTTTEQEPPADAPIAAVADPSFIERTWRYLQPTRHTAWSEVVAASARESTAEAASVMEAVHGVTSLVGEKVEYRPGATHIGVDVDTIWNDRVGVCQDFAHLTIAMLRSVGLPARYVSGYFYASDPSRSGGSEDGEIVVATHAWVEVALPSGGWWAIDPTNDDPVGERHVKIGHGRDYDDVTPLRGVYYGESEHSLAAEVTMSMGMITRQALPHVEFGTEMAAQQ